MLTFQPSEGRLAGDTRYTVTLDTTATDAEGYPIQSTAYSWQFTTGPDVQLVGFGSGEHNQVLNLRDSRAVQYSFPYDQQPLPVRFDLYHLSLEQWPSGQTGTFVQSWDEAPTPPSEYYVHIQETILPDTLTAGIYQLNISTAGKKEDTLTIFLSDQVLLAQNDGQDWLFWLATLDGVSLPDAELRLYDAGNHLLTTGKTDENGLWRIAAADLPITPKQLIALSGDDVTLLGLEGAWNYQAIYAQRDAYVGMIYSDRPVYIPGQTIQFRGIVRGQTTAALEMVPVGTPVTVELLSSDAEYGFDYELLTSQTLTTNGFGTVNGSFTLDAAAAPGPYLLRLRLGDEVFPHPLTVQPAPSTMAQLTLTTDAPLYADGDTVNLTATLRDAQAQPIPHQLIETRVYLWTSDTPCWRQMGQTGYWGG